MGAAADPPPINVNITDHPKVILEILSNQHDCENDDVEVDIA